MKRFDFKKRVARLREVLHDKRLDALVVLTVEDSNRNVQYLTGFGGTTGVLLISPKQAVLAVDGRYTERARKEAVGVTVVEIPRGGKELHNVAYIKEALKPLDLSHGARVGFESARIPFGWITTWKALPIELFPTEHIVERLRQVKDTEEIAHLSKAARATSLVFKTVSRKVRAGMRERDVAFLLDTELLKVGAVTSSFRTIVASGPNSAIPHHETGDRKLKAGEPLIMDFGGLFPGGYCSDITRTIFVPGARVSPKMVSVYRTVLEANRKAFQALKPGISWKEYDGVARDYITEKGYADFFLHGLGHSLGLETHDPYDYAHDAFRPGTVMTNEPGIYIQGVGGVRIEDDIVITKTGAKRLSDAPYLPI